MDDALQAGAARFSGFGALYDDVRPEPPAELSHILAEYLGGRPERVVDLGSGTGLSTRWAARWANEVVGVEPSEDMRTIAEARDLENAGFRSGWSHSTGLERGDFDVVLAVQALHWMEPGGTFAEVSRLLRPGGVFAAIDCDWPPVIGDRLVEQAWDTCRRRLRVAEARVASGAAPATVAAPIVEGDQDAVGYSGADAHVDRRLAGGVRSWSKSQHLERMIASGSFEWCREIALISEETGNADRLMGLLKSQGDYQTLRRHGLKDQDLGVDTFERVVLERLGHGDGVWRFVYRTRLGFKK